MGGNPIKLIHCVAVIWGHSVLRHWERKENWKLSLKNTTGGVMRIKPVMSYTDDIITGQQLKLKTLLTLIF